MVVLRSPRCCSAPRPRRCDTGCEGDAEASGTPTTVLARRALTDWLERRERERIAEELHAFAVEHAGSELDLDEGLEGGAHEVLAEDSG